MTKLTITTGNFALVNPIYDTWAIDDGSHPHVYRRVVNGAATMLDGCIVDVYLTREAAENAIDPAYRAEMDEAKRRSGAEWA